MNTQKDFDLYDEQITEILENYVLSRTVFRSLDGGTKKWGLSQRPIDKKGRFIWYIASKTYIDKHMFDFCDLRVTLDKSCLVHLYFRNDKFITNENGFQEFLRENLLSLNRVDDEDTKLDGKCVTLSNIEQLSTFLTFTV